MPSCHLHTCRRSLYLYHTVISGRGALPDLIFPLVRFLFILFFFGVCIPGYKAVLQDLFGRGIAWKVEIQKKITVGCPDPAAVVAEGGDVHSVRC